MEPAAGRQRRGPAERMMSVNRYVKVIATDIALALVAVGLYSPGLLGLSPMDPDIVRAAISVSAGVALVGVAGVTNARLLRGTSKVPLQIGSGTGSDVSGMSSFDDVYTTLVDYQGDKVLGTYAVQGMERMEESARKSTRLSALVGAKFEHGSISWTRFMGVVDSVTTTITRNSAILANRIQAFDIEGYERDNRLIRSQDYLYDNVPDDIQLERYGLYEQSMSAMQDIINANERLLLELDKLSAELTNLDSNILTTESEEMLDEIRNMVEQTRFYAE